MNVGEVNKGAIILILVLMLGAGGYLWYTMMYKPAVSTRDTAMQSQTAAEQDLAAAKTELASAQQRVEDSKQEASKADDSVQRLQLARKAVPADKYIDDAAIVLMDIADQSGIKTSFKASDEADQDTTTDTSGLQGAKPVDLTFDAVGTYSEMMYFMRRVEDTVETKDGKLYARDRLFNVVKLEIGADGESASGSSTSDEAGFGLANSSGASTEEIPVGPGEMRFTVVIRMYTSSTENSENVGIGTPDPAAAPLDGAAGNPNAAGTGAGTDPNAAGTGSVPGADPNAAGASTGDPNAAGAGASVAPATAPTGGGI